MSDDSQTLKARLSAAADQLEQLNRTNRVPDGEYGFIDVPHGWSLIVADLHQQLVARWPSYEVNNVMDLYGELRYYCSVENFPEARKLIDQAEQQAARTCQVCGRGGKLREMGTLWATLCDDLNAYFQAGEPLWMHVRNRTCQADGPL